MTSLHDTMGAYAPRKSAPRPPSPDSDCEPEVITYQQQKIIYNGEELPPRNRLEHRRLPYGICAHFYVCGHCRRYGGPCQQIHLAGFDRKAFSRKVAMQLYHHRVSNIGEFKRMLEKSGKLEDFVHIGGAEIGYFVATFETEEGAWNCLSQPLHYDGIPVTATPDGTGKKNIASPPLLSSYSSIPQTSAVAGWRCYQKVGDTAKISHPVHQDVLTLKSPRRVAASPQTWKTPSPSIGLYQEQTVARAAYNRGNIKKEPVMRVQNTRQISFVAPPNERPMTKERVPSKFERRLSNVRSLLQTTERQVEGRTEDEAKRSLHDTLVSKNRRNVNQAGGGGGSGRSEPASQQQQAPARPVVEQAKGAKEPSPKKADSGQSPASQKVAPEPALTTQKRHVKNHQPKVAKGPKRPAQKPRNQI
ncbi:hypothetical protein HK097_010765, partial [Rhizophlyctis rosea]